MKPKRKVNRKGTKKDEPEVEELLVEGFEEGSIEDPTVVLPPECSSEEQFELLLRWSSLAYFASQLLSGPPEAPYNGHFMVAPHHLRWSDLVADHKRLCINAARNHGKCPAAGTLILTPSGERVRVEDWRGGAVLAFDDKTHTYVEAYATPAVQLPKQRCYRITTATGREITVNSEHPFCQYPNKWTHASDIRVGDRIAVPRSYTELGSRSIPYAYSVAVIIADGGLTHMPNLTCSEERVQQRVAEEVASLGWGVSHWQNGNLGLNKAQTHLREWGLMGLGSYDKIIPDFIFTGDKKSTIDFISGYTDTDCHVTANPKNGGSIEYYSVSESILRGLQHLLLRVGIIGILKVKNGRYKGSNHKSYRLTLRGDQALKLCQIHTCVGDVVGRLDKLQDLLSRGRAPSRRTIDAFPKDVYGSLVETSSWHRRHGGKAYSSSYEPSRNSVKRIAELEANTTLIQHVNSPTMWDKVVTVEDVGEQHVYNIQVDGLHTYVANDIVNHNSHMFSLAYPLWMAWKNPNRYGIIFSATDEQARRILGDIKTELETNPKLSFLLDAKPKKWNESEIHLSNGHVIYAKSFGTKVRGNHPTWAVADDVLNDETMNSEAVRRKQNDYFFSAIVGMMHSNDPLIVIGTPFTAADLYGEVQKRKGFHFEKFAALYRDINGVERALWPERFSVAELEHIRDEMIGNIRFTREFLCVPIADEMSLFPSHLWKGDPVEQYQLKLGMPREFWANAGMELYVGVDFAISSNIGADHTVIIVLALDKYGNRWIVDIRRFHGMPYKQQKSEIVKVGREYDPEIMVLESNQMQRIWGDELISETDLPIFQHTTNVEKHSLAKGIPSIRMLLDNKKYRIPRGDEHSVRMTELLIAEMAGFTFDKGKVLSVSEHDDVALSLYMAEIGIRRMAYTDTTDSSESEMQLGTTGSNTPSEPVSRIPSDDYYPGEDETPMLPGLNMHYLY